MRAAMSVRLSSILPPAAADGSDPAAPASPSLEHTEPGIHCVPPATGSDPREVFIPHTRSGEGNEIPGETNKEQRTGRQESRHSFPIFNHWLLHFEIVQSIQELLKVLLTADAIQLVLESGGEAGMG